MNNMIEKRVIGVLKADELENTNFKNGLYFVNPEVAKEIYKTRNYQHQRRISEAQVYKIGKTVNKRGWQEYEPFYFADDDEMGYKTVLVNGQHRMIYISREKSGELCNIVKSGLSAKEIYKSMDTLQRPRHPKDVLLSYQEELDFLKYINISASNASKVIAGIKKYEECVNDDKNTIIDELIEECNQHTDTIVSILKVIEESGHSARIKSKFLNAKLLSLLIHAVNVDDELGINFIRDVVSSENGFSELHSIISHSTSKTAPWICTGKAFSLILKNKEQLKSYKSYCERLEGNKIKRVNFFGWSSPVPARIF